ncbi:hypothetical protein OG828_20015 [Streptomyces sp. NBC_00457]|uniref:hypothetical protein n=1 Tax=Streptomyces sp. NBC_00457 TaxID=2975748 RepID=UPI002E1F4DDA
MRHRLAQRIVGLPLCLRPHQLQWPLRQVRKQRLELGDSSGPFQRNNDNAATSVLFKGTTGLAVKFYEGPGYSGGHLCLEASEAYADSLAGTTFSNGTPANDNISSHRWVPSSECGAFLD